MVKVRPFGQVADRLVEPLVTALADALDGAPAIECAVGPATRRLGGQWLGARSTAWTILPPRYSRPLRRSFRSPIHSRSRPTSCSRAAGCLSDLAGAPVGAAWTADAVFLVADRSSPHDIRFDDLAEFRLGG